MPDALAVLRKQMRAVQIAALRQGRAAVIAIEGHDAAGKGGVIRELSYAMDPRGFCVYPIGAPTSTEAFRPFLWRFWSRLPAPGQLVIFDRSWYGRVLVERVEQGLSDQAYVSAFDAIDTFEATLEDQDIPLIKCFWISQQRSSVNACDDGHEFLRSVGSSPWMISMPGSIERPMSTRLR